MDIDDSLKPQVRQLVEHLVRRLPEPHASRLAAQARTISALSGNLAFISFEVDKRSTEPSPGIANPIEKMSAVVNASGSSDGFIMAWRDDDGYLDSLEYTWWADETPDGLPGISDLEPWDSD